MSWYEDETVTVLHGDCIEVMRSLPDDSVDSIVTDPPYGLGFMGKAWDDLPPGLPWAQECLRVLKPGGHLLAFGGTRTWHRLAVAVEDAGFEVRDSIAWLYGSGFPKSLDVSKAIDKTDAADERRARALRFTAWMREHLTARQIDDATGTNMGGHYITASSQPAVATLAHLDALRPLLPEVPEWVEEMARQRTVESENFKARPIVGERKQRSNAGNPDRHVGLMASVHEVETMTAPATPAAQQWAGWGTALKPAFEPVVVARKPLVGTVAGNVLAFGTGALNIDGCRVGNEERTYGPSAAPGGNAVRLDGGDGRDADNARRYAELSKQRPPVTVSGRWPANVVLDGTQADALDTQSGTLKSGANPTRRGADTTRDAYGEFAGQAEVTPARGADSGGASRFFPTFRYQAKAPTSERPKVDGIAHPTVKPLELMRWLVRLVTPPGGTVLEPFAGSGTTVEAAMLEGFRVTAIEREADYLPLILARINRVGVTPPPPEPASTLFDLIEGDVA